MLRYRLAISRFHWRQGRAFGYPWCCTAHFCIDALLGWRAAPLREDPNEIDGRPGIVCGIFHAGQSTLPLHRRIVEMLRWQLPYVRPGARGKAFRRAVGHSSCEWPHDWEDPAAGYHDEYVGDPELEWF